MVGRIRHVPPFLPKSDWSLDLLVFLVLWWWLFCVVLAVVVVVRICNLLSPGLAVFVLFPVCLVREVISEMTGSSGIDEENWCVMRIHHRMACACHPIS